MDNMDSLWKSQEVGEATRGVGEAAPGLARQPALLQTGMFITNARAMSGNLWYK